MRTKFKKILTVLLILSQSIPLVAAAENKNIPETAAFANSPKDSSLPLIRLSADLGFGYVVLGEQIKLAGTLQPSPDYYVDYFYGATLAIMPGNIGADFGFHRKLFRAASFQAGGGFSVFNYDVASGGVLFQFPLDKAKEQKNKTAFLLGAGVNFTMLSLHDDFKNLISKTASSQGLSVTFNKDPATGIGGYIKGGLFYGITDNIFFQVFLQLNYTNPKFSGATNSLDGLAIELPFSIGLCF